jgi:hypothetical protein
LAENKFFIVIILLQLRSDTTQCLSTTLPVIHDKAQQLEPIFERIDKLEVVNADGAAIVENIRNLFLQFI